MEPQSTLDGLMSAGQERASALASGVPALPAGNYTAGFAAAVEAALAAHYAGLAALAAFGTATAASTVATTETVEADSAAALSI